MKKRGLTLIELLAVIIILALIALISIPLITNIIEKAEKGSAESSIIGYVDSIEKQIGLNLLDDNKENIVSGTYTVEEMENYGVSVKGEKPDSGSIVISNRVDYATFCINNYKVEYKNNKAKAMEDSNCSQTKEIVYRESILNGSYPVLDDGMIAVEISNNGTVKKADLNNKWYSYEDKKWANAVLVNETNRNVYQNSEIGTIIPETDILAYFVWIPRYEYETITNTTATEIKVNFISKNKTTATSNYLINPAFTYDNNQLSGIWVGKFETTGTADNPTIKPNISSLRNQNISSQFKTSLIFGNKTLNNDGSVTDNSNKTQYGLIGESKMMKNTEWGAVAYLSHSAYGINSEVRINNNSNYITGCGASTVNGALTTLCQLAYASVNEYPQSTTGNITGIFDMNGGAWEWVMAVMADAADSSTPFSGYSSLYNSGFNGKYTQGGSNTTGITFVDSKYYDLYTYGLTYNDVTAYSRRILGDATSETKGWYDDYAYFVTATYPWFSRGGYYCTGATDGIFCFNHSSGYAVGNASFRTVIIK